MNQSLRRWSIPSGLCHNMRDIGGYATASGVTKFGVFLRSDLLHGLTQADIDFLLARGLRDVVDLRSDTEQANQPNSFAHVPDVKLHGFLDHASRQTIMRSLDNPVFSKRDMGEEYIDMVDALGDFYALVIRELAYAKGLSIYHCTAGKDRTGIITAFLLLSLGVSPVDVIADYTLSTVFMQEKNERAMAQFPDIPKYMFASDASNMETLIAHLNDAYGGARQYLTSHGVGEDVFCALEAKLLRLK